MHYSIISAAGNFTISKRTIILDPNITTFRDFVSKQIGDGDITIDDQIENTPAFADTMFQDALAIFQMRKMPV